MAVAGIDLGTTFSAIAYLDGEGRPKILENREGDRTTPSAVNFDENGAPLVGVMAKQLSVEQPGNTVQYVKRSIGDKNWHFLTDSGERYSAEAISALILKRLKDDAESLLGEPLQGVVITVPAYFDDAQRKATHDAGSIAGLNVLKIINEPTAAALAYGCCGGGGDEVVAVYDLGGGTFDVTVMKVGGEAIEVLATGGDRNLGGFDWDNALMVFLSEEFKRQTGLDLLADTDTGEAFLRDKAENAKKALTLRESTTLSLTFDGKRGKIELDRRTFAGLTESLLKRTLDIMRMTLEEAAKVPEDEDISLADLIGRLGISKILLVGGSTRMVMVRESLEKETGLTPSIELNPDEVVALGAALQAGISLAKSSGEKKGRKMGLPDKLLNMRIQDVNSHGLGVVALKGDGDEEYNAIVMPKNTAIPAAVSEVFYTAVDNQTGLMVQVTEGDDEDLSMVRIIGEAAMSIAPHPKGSPVEVAFQYDESGIVHVRVKDKLTGKDLGEVVIQRTSNLDEEEVRMLKARIGEVRVD